MAFTNYFKVISVFLFLSVIRDSETIACPNPEVIWPCTCHFYKSVHCENIENITQILTGISKYFKAEFKLHLWSLKSNVLPAKFLGTFRPILVKIIETPLEDVDDEAFEGQDETLEELIFANTKLKSISAFKLKKLKKLTRLEIYRTKTITSIRKEDIMELPKSITLLSIWSNSISYIDAGSFQQLPNLKSLQMDENQLASVPEKSLPAGLESISFGLNRFDHFPMHIYKECPELEFLRIDWNNISQIPKELGDIMESRNVSIQLTGNPLSCGCDLKWLGLYNDNKTTSSKVFGVCNGNNSRHGVLLQRLTNGSFDDCYHH